MFAAKNLILAGVKSVTLHDEGIVELWDLSSNFIFSEEDLGKNRALASVSKLQELNKSVIIATLTNELRKEQLSDFQVYKLFSNSNGWTNTKIILVHPASWMIIFCAGPLFGP